MELHENRAAVTSFVRDFWMRFDLPFHAVLSKFPYFFSVIKFQMAQQCSQNEYFDGLLRACKPCHLRCPNTPPVSCQRYCNSSLNNSVKGSNVIILWTCLGLCMIVSLAVFVLMFLFKKMSAELLKDKLKNTGPALQDVAKADLDNSKTGVDIVLPRGLGYTVEECSCEDCVKSKPKVDLDHVFPFPAMEEGATILVTTKTSDHSNSLPGAADVIQHHQAAAIVNPNSR
ncbi:PREDICTED: tumor necrosis factor receptor superfamily member 17 [Elephantulus edwardii]|uniref:tumor necrosis factor receptor superfamily member 17 n=1 Tax=Elephantulus edwardii TaxID=28737 RepID=UPI0003F07D74|nr:PREDICTED: tumor necrosis factor receptor superfamily member 17 [Elephantulus edwardii]